MTVFNMSVGGIVLSAVSNDPGERFAVDPARRQFSTERRPDITLSMHRREGIPLVQPHEEVFYSGGLWALYRRNGRYVFCARPDIEKSPNRVAVISKNFRSGDVYLDKQKTPPELSQEYPLNYPMDEILMIHLFPEFAGILVHACGIKHKDKGAIFIGASGAGKSTMANLWMTEKEAVILSDDRMVIRKTGPKFRIFGTPWHGDVRICSPENTAVEKIFFIKHARENVIKKLSPTEAASRLIARSFIPLWDKERMGLILKISSEIVRALPCYELGFLPDKSAVKFLKDII